MAVACPVLIGLPLLCYDLSLSPEMPVAYRMIRYTNIGRTAYPVRVRASSAAVASTAMSCSSWILMP